VRVRLVLGVALAVVAGALILDASGHAVRGAGSDHSSPTVFTPTVPPGGVVCQPAAFLPDDAARVQILVGSFGRPVPDLRLRFLDAGNTEIATGHLPAGAREGIVTIPLRHAHAARTATSVCITAGRTSPIALGGETGPINPSSEQIDGRQQPGRISLLYFRPGAESWWHLLPELTRRFGLGKASFFGDWTLPVAALLLLSVWVAAIRLLARELA
jgi:hypothetical protein